MRLYDAAGFLAASLVITAFWMKDIIALRCIALASNIAFLIYGSGLGLLPVWALHAALLPINASRLYQALWCDRCGQRAVQAGAMRQSASNPADRSHPTIEVKPTTDRSTRNG